MQTIQLEVGKRYKTRRGRQVTIHQKLNTKTGGRDFLEDYPYLGGNGCHYSKEGRLIQSFDSANDIVEEIQNPA